MLTGDEVKVTKNQNDNDRSGHFDSLRASQLSAANVACVREPQGSRTSLQCLEAIYGTVHASAVSVGRVLQAEEAVVLGCYFSALPAEQEPSAFRLTTA
jgi:hypothetical protein